MDTETFNLIWNFQHGYWRFGYPESGAFSPEIMSKLFVEHKSKNEKIIPILNRDSIDKLIAMLNEANLDKAETKLIAERVVCEYVINMNVRKTNPRISKIGLEIQNVIDSSISLERALRNLSSPCISALSQLMGAEYDGSDEEPSFKSYDLFFAYVERNEQVKALINPEILFSLVDLTRAAKEFIAEMPEDPGGPISGIHDSSGARVRTHLTKVVRVLLKHLGLPCGSQKGGPVSTFLKLVHEAATGKTPSWADRYAEQALKLEKEYVEQCEERKAYLARPHGDRLAEIASSGIIEKGRALRTARMDAYLEEIKKFEEAPKVKVLFD